VLALGGWFAVKAAIKAARFGRDKICDIVRHRVIERLVSQL
jgi:hypothetical protein